MPIEPKLKTVPQAPMKMGREFFRQIRDRIETIAPIQTTSADLITVKYLEDQGCKISFTPNVVTLTVCSNGTPAELVVYSP